MYNTENNFEKFPGAHPEQSVQPLGQDFEKSFESGVPPFAGEQFGIASESNRFYGETTDNDTEKEADNEGITDAAALINYGLDAVAREKGVEATIQCIKGFDASGSDNPIRDLFDTLGINTEKEIEDAQSESDATKHLREQFRNEYNMPKTSQKTQEGAIKAIADMKELISEVEGADPRYEELRQAARTAGKGYFEYAVQDYGTRGLTELFATLAAQKEKSSNTEPEATSDVASETTSENSQEDTLDIAPEATLESEPDVVPETSDKETSPRDQSQDPLDPAKKPERYSGSAEKLPNEE